jgi:hypothetical protein
MQIVDWNKIDDQEIKDILEWMDSDTDFYVRFIQWRHVRDQIKQAEQEYAIRELSGTDNPKDWD